MIRMVKVAFFFFFNKNKRLELILCQSFFDNCYDKLVSVKIL